VRDEESRGAEVQDWLGDIRGPAVAVMQENRAAHLRGYSEGRSIPLHDALDQAHEAGELAGRK